MVLPDNQFLASDIKLLKLIRNPILIIEIIFLGAPYLNALNFGAGNAFTNKLVMRPNLSDTPSVLVSNDTFLNLVTIS